MHKAGPSFHSGAGFSCREAAGVWTPGKELAKIAELGWQSQSGSWELPLSVPPSTLVTLLGGTKSPVLAALIGRVEGSHITPWRHSCRLPEALGSHRICNRAND